MPVSGVLPTTKRIDVIRFEVSPEKLTENKERLGFYINHVSAEVCGDEMGKSKN